MSRLQASLFNFIKLRRVLVKYVRLQFHPHKILRSNFALVFLPKFQCCPCSPILLNQCCPCNFRATSWFFVIHLTELDDKGNIETSEKLQWWNWSEEFYKNEIETWHINSTRTKVVVKPKKQKQHHVKLHQI